MAAGTFAHALQALQHINRMSVVYQVSRLSKSVKSLSLLPWRGAGPALYISPYLDATYSHTVRNDSGAGIGALHFCRLFREVDN